MSCSADGKLLLWECSSGKELTIFRNENYLSRGPINCLRIFQNENDANFEKSEEFFWKKETFAICGTEEGFLRIISVPKGEIQFEHKFNSGNLRF